MLSNEQVISIATDILYLDDFLLATLESATGTEWLDGFTKDLSEDELKSIVLMMHTGEVYEDLYEDDYKVLTDDEAEDAFREYAQNYYDDIIEPEIPEYLRRYFDEDLWISDYIDEANRGDALSADGSEHEYQLLGQTFYIYEE